MRTLVLLLFLCSIAGSPNAVEPLTTELVADRLSSPIFITHAPGDSERLYIVEKAGRIRILQAGTVKAQPLLDIDSLVQSSGGEQGLLGIAFHPNYPDSNYLFVNYTNNSGDTRVSRFDVANPDSADPNTQKVILAVDQPFSNHNAGMLAFSPLDGYLYVGLGDGGSGGDPGNRAQDPSTLLGKMLRIDINAPVGTPYAIPPDNPFVAAADTLDEIWAFGLRNPWRYAFDPVNGDLYIGDVGQAELEEVDYQPGTSNGGENYGWRLKEGTSCYNPSTGCDTLSGLTDPIYEYTHGGTPFRCSITGGYVYRGCAMPELYGTYFFGDYCSGQVWTFRYDGSSLTEFTDRTSELGLPSIAIVSFGTDYFGELYIVSLGGAIYRVIPDGVPSACDCCTGIRGNVNGDANDNIDVSDLSFMVDFLFRGGVSPSCPDEADLNGDGATNVSDLNYLVDFLFRGGPDPASCPA